MNFFQKLYEKGIRVSLEAEKLLENADEEIINEIISLNLPFIKKEDVEKVLKKREESKVEIIRTKPKAIASEYSGKVKILHHFDVTGKSRTTGSVGDFLTYFQNRFKRLSKILRSSGANAFTISEAKTPENINKEVEIISLIYDIKETKNGNILLEIEDLETRFRAVIPKNSKAFLNAKSLVRDEVVLLKGRITENFLIVNDITFPDIPITKEKKIIEEDIAAAYISDIHVGSKHFLNNHFLKFIEWLKRGEGLASKVKYLFFAGDIVDGIGIYPSQEKDLTIRDIFKQYEEFSNYLEMLPDYIEVIISPGNHDIVRRAEPMPAIDKSLIRRDCYLIGNPSYVEIDGIKHLIYHGTSIDMMIASIPYLSYNAPEKVGKEFLRKRHLSPIYGGNLIVPEHVDYLLIEEIPDVLHCGHVHKHGYLNYRNVHIIISGTFQDRTQFQIEQGHIPTPGIVGFLELRTGMYKTINFLH